MVICFSSYESQILSMGTAQDFGSVSIQSSVEMRDGFLQLCDIFAAWIASCFTALTLQLAVHAHQSW